MNKMMNMNDEGYHGIRRCLSSGHALEYLLQFVDLLQYLFLLLLVVLLLLLLQPVGGIDLGVTGGAGNAALAGPAVEDVVDIMADVGHHFLQLLLQVALALLLQSAALRKLEVVAHQLLVLALPLRTHRL
jgi:preprotein translocase subunit SecG